MTKETHFFEDLNDLNTQKFSELYTSQLEDILDDPNSKILITDFRKCDIYISRFLKQRFFRNVVLYHMNKTPRINMGNYKTKGGFKTKETCLIKIREKVNVIHDVK